MPPPLMLQSITTSRSRARCGIDARAGRPATQSEEQLLRRYRNGDLAAREELVHRFLPLTNRLAARYRHTSESREDLEQVACLGLIKAIDRYDSNLGPFAAYAVPNIIGELKRHFRDKGWGMRVPRSLQERVRHVNQAIEVLANQLGRSPSPKDIAAHTGLTTEDVGEALEASSAYSPSALDAPCPGDDNVDHRASGENLGSEDPGYGLVELDDALTPAFRALPIREQTILKLRFAEDLRQTEIAERVGISQMHVSRLLRRALDRLQVAADTDCRR
jgi:RNA polymerase sigma-B factor